LVEAGLRSHKVTGSYRKACKDECPDEGGSGYYDYGKKKFDHVGQQRIG
jgi:hypothetical protein